MSESKVIKIVYAEDSRAIYNLIISKLHAEGWEVLHFENGDGVADAVLNSKPDVVILDKEMPVKDGMIVLEELKANPETKDVPIIFFTTKSDPQTVMRCLQLGVTDFVVKDSLAVANLIPRIKGIIGRH
ncbi:MAG TPA: response regulator [Ignavibacteriales bacterium]|nr:response regulator [Ignavibacteriales bacterium]